MIKVVLIGSGNVAQHLIQVLLQAKEVDLVQAFARNPSHLSHLLPEEKITSDYQKIAELKASKYQHLHFDLQIKHFHPKQLGTQKY